MLNRCLLALLVANSSCSSSTAPPARTEAPLAGEQRVTKSRTQIAPAREATPAFSLTASDGSGLRLVRASASAVIEGPLAFTELHLRFLNAENRVREGTFSITLPAGAAISRFAMEEDGRMKEAEVVAKALARRAYDDMLHRRIDPALLEKAPGNQFTARVFPIAGKTEKHIVISYSQELTSEAYTLPLRGLPKIDNVSIQLVTRGPDGADRTQSLERTGWQPDIDFVGAVPAKVAVRDGALVAGAFDVVQTFSEVAANGGQAMADRPSEITLLVDTSASRALGFARYVENVHRLVTALAARHDNLQLRVIAFDQTTQLIYAGSAAGFGMTELETLMKRGPGGASDLAIAASLAKGRTVILTDGVVTAGLEGVELGKAFANTERVDIVLAGGIRDERVARSLTRAGKRAGDVFDLDAEGIEPIVSGLGEQVRVDVQIQVPNATWFYPKTIPSVRNGSQVLVYARLATPRTPFEVTIGGLRWTAPVTRATPALLSRAVARIEIDELETTLAATPATETKTAARLRGEIEKKSVAARVISSETTMLVLDTEEDYARYAIDRKALADILVVGPNGLEQSKRTYFASRSRRHDALTREQAIEQARHAGILGSVSGFASLTSTADLSSGFDDRNVYGGIGTGRYATLGHGAGFGRSSSAGRGMIRSRVAAVPAIHIAMPVVQGSLDKSIIRRYIKRRINQISYCYERELLSRPTLAGTVQTQFMIADGGKVTSVTASGVDDKVAKCIADVIKTIEFPTVVDGAVQVSYPFTFRTAAAIPEPTTTAIEELLGKGVTVPAPPPVSAPAVAARPEPTPAPAPRIAAERVVREPAPEPVPPPVAPAPPPLPIGDPPVGALDGKLQVVMKALARKDTAKAVQLATTWRDEAPGDVLAWVALGEALEARGDRAGAARAYGSIIDLFGARAEYRRFAGERLERTGERNLTVDTYRRAVADRPDQLTGHRLLAYALLRAGDHAGAFAAILKGVDQSAPSDRYAGAPAIFARDAGMIGAAYIAAHGERRGEVTAALMKRSLKLVTSPSTRFMLYWETDANDVDLHVRDKHGDHAFFSDRELASGGELHADVTTGFGPECFEIEGKLPAAPYELGVHYYAQGPMGYGMGLLQIQRFDGRAFTFEDRPYVIMKDDARISLGKVR